MRLHLARLGGFLFLLCLSLAWPAWAQPADVAHSKDHPLLTRYPNSHIEIGRHTSELQSP